MDARRDDEQTLRQAVVEVLDRDGHARQIVPVWHWPITVGRSVQCDVVLDDPHVASLHATLVSDDGAVSLHVGETVNGAEVRNRRVSGGQRADLPSGDVFQLGGTRLRVRLASDPVAPERVLVPDPATRRGSLIGLALVLLAWTVAAHWIDTDPGARFTDYLSVLVGSPLLVAVWCGLWALASKLFRHRLEYWRHARIAISYLLVDGVTGLLLPLAAYALSLPFLSRITDFVSAAVLWAMVLQHLTVILPSHRRVLAIGTSVVFVAGVALVMARNYQVHDRFFGPLYVTTLAPPALRLAPAVTTTRFLEESQQLKSALDAHAKDDDGDAESSDE